jgi:hypothetical protein
MTTDATEAASCATDKAGRATFNDLYARWAYEELIVLQSHVQFDGLWRRGSSYFIKCPSVATALAVNGQGLAAWFDHGCRVVATDVRVVDLPPPDSVRLPERPASERFGLRGAPRNLTDLLYDFSLHLPPEFPDFRLDATMGSVRFVTDIPLTSQQENEVALAHDAIQPGVPLEFLAQARASEKPRTASKTNAKSGEESLIIVPSRRLPAAVGGAVRLLVEEDDHFWIRTRQEVFGKPRTTSAQYVPEPWRPRTGLSCFVDATVFPPHNLRTYLSLYDYVFLALPIVDYFENACHAMAVTQDELRHLVALGRVRIVLPQPIARYPISWLNRAVEESPQRFILSRRLAAATIADARQRIPLLYPPLAPHERHDLLAGIARTLRDAGVPDDPRKKIVAQIGEAWSGAEWFVHSIGAMGTAHSGVGALASALCEAATGQDLRIELSGAASKVEWGGALNAHVFPSAIEGYDELRACDLVAGIYSPRVREGRLVAPIETLSATDELLALDSNVPVVAFATEFASTDIQRLREMMQKVVDHNQHPDFLRDAIAKFNADVRHYERSPGRLTALNIVGLMSGVAAAASVVPPEIQNLVPLAGTLVGFIVNQALAELPRHSKAGGALVDFANALLVGRSDPDVVLVARVRREIKTFKA